MKRLLILAISAAFAIGVVGAQEEGLGEPRVSLEYGPIAGITYVIIEPADFNTRIQVMYPNTDAFYYPLFTEIGVFAKQMTELGQTGGFLTFQELLTFGGLDQNMAMPTMKFLIGYRGRVGTEIAVGPYIAFNTPEDGVKLRFSFAYVIGWTIRSRGVSIPIHFSFVPYPSYQNARLTLTTGFSFSVDE